MTKAMPPVCQSCAMPMEFPKDSGTEANSTPSKHYCRECYQDGKFTKPELTMYDVMARAAEQMGDLPTAEATDLAYQAVPKLKRWRLRGLVERFTIWLPGALSLGGFFITIGGLVLLRFRIPIVVNIVLVVSGIVMIVVGQVLVARYLKQTMQMAREALAKQGITTDQGMAAMAGRTKADNER